MASSSAASPPGRHTLDASNIPFLGLLIDMLDRRRTFFICVDLLVTIREDAVDRSSEPSPFTTSRIRSIAGFASPPHALYVASSPRRSSIRRSSCSASSVSAPPPTTRSSAGSRARSRRRIAIAHAELIVSGRAGQAYEASPRVRTPRRFEEIDARQRAQEHRAVRRRDRALRRLLRDDGSER